ncbi:unnamed protein product, partial [Callosobruchus maculatus]
AAECYRCERLRYKLSVYVLCYKRLSDRNQYPYLTVALETPCIVLLGSKEYTVKNLFILHLHTIMTELVEIPVRVNQDENEEPIMLIVNAADAAKIYDGDEALLHQLSQKAIALGNPNGKTASDAAWPTLH